MSALSVNPSMTFAELKELLQDDRRQLEHPRAQARGRGLRRLQEALLRPRAENRVQLDRERQANLRAPSRTHGSADSRGERHLRAMHTAIIMDGNGRWAERRGLPRSAGHRAGAKAVRRIVEAATRGPIDILTLYAFSSDNWSRPAQEVASLMRLLKRYLVSETARCLDNGVRLSVIGRRDRLSRDLVRTIENTERHHGRRREAALAPRRRLLGACGDRAKQRHRARSPEEFERELAAAVHSDVDAPVDLVDPHGRRAPLERLPALGIRVRGARVRRHVLARLRRSGVRRRAARVRAPRSPLRPGSGNRRAGRLLARRITRRRLRRPARPLLESAVRGAYVERASRCARRRGDTCLQGHGTTTMKASRNSHPARRSIPANRTSSRRSCSSRPTLGDDGEPVTTIEHVASHVVGGKLRWQVATLGQSVPLTHAVGARVGGFVRREPRYPDRLPARRLDGRCATPRRRTRGATASASSASK